MDANLTGTERNGTDVLSLWGDPLSNAVDRNRIPNTSFSRVIFILHTLRRELLTAVSEFCQPTLALLPFGKPDLTVEQNAFIMKVKQIQ